MNNDWKKIRTTHQAFMKKLKDFYELNWWLQMIKNTHMWRRWGTPQNLIFGMFWFLTIFCLFTSSPLTTRKIKILKIWKNARKYHFTHVHHMKIIWCMVPLICSATDKIFLIFDQFFSFNLPNKPENQNFENMKKSLEILSFYTYTPQMNIIWYMVPEIWSATQFFLISDHFSHFYPLTIQKIKIFKIRKKPGYINILQMCTINENHIIYGSWDMEHDRTFFNFGLFFAHLPP